MNKAEFLQRFHHVRTVQAESDFPIDSNCRNAAVLLPIVDNPEGLTLLLTKRAEHLKHHPGQISFPGGKIEPSDSSAEYAAMREAHEEVGLKRDNVHVIGQLPQYRTISKYLVTPVIGMVSVPLALRINRDEVAEAFEVPLSYICQPENHIAYPVVRGGIRQTLYFMPYQTHMIWGVTAAIIRNLSNHLYDF